MIPGSPPTVDTAVPRPTGTPERSWAAWPPLRTLPRVELPRGQVVVVSAHPDDEILGAGGLLAGLAASPAPEPRFVLATDGEASHAHAPEVDPGALADERVHELIDGLHALGHQAPLVRRLRLPDGRLEAYADDLAYRIERSVRGADLVLCPASYDGHPDHEALGRVTVEVCAGNVEVWQFPIWVWHWTTPGAPTVDWCRARRLDLDCTWMERKRAALESFRTQVTPIDADPERRTILPDPVLDHFRRPFEVFVT